MISVMLCMVVSSSESSQCSPSGLLLSGGVDWNCSCSRSSSAIRSSCVCDCGGSSVGVWSVGMLGYGGEFEEGFIRTCPALSLVSPGSDPLGSPVSCALASAPVIPCCCCVVSCCVCAGWLLSWGVCAVGLCGALFGLRCWCRFRRCCRGWVPGSGSLGFGCFFEGCCG